MNIFYLDKDVQLCAQQHCDRHVVSQCKEYAQILSTAHRIVDGYEYIDNSSGRNIKRWKLLDDRETGLYKSTHYNHRSVVWCRQSQQNYYWLYQLFLRLLAEYKFRYNKVHACTKLIPFLGLAPRKIDWKLFTEPTPAMPTKYIVNNDSMQSYRNYYNGDKVHLHNWTNRPTPEWIV